MYNLEILPQIFCVCKPYDINSIDFSADFTFTGLTDKEISVLCPEESAPPSQSIEKGWRGMRIAGALDFSLIGVLAPIANLLAENGIGIFVISTFDTDYIFVKNKDLEKAKTELKNSGYVFIN